MIPRPKKKFFDLTKKPCRESKRLELAHCAAIKKAVQESKTQTKH